MKRRSFIACSMASPILATPWQAPTSPKKSKQATTIRELFPRLENEVYINAASLMPLGDFTAQGLHNYTTYRQQGSYCEEAAYVDKAIEEVRPLFASLIGAKNDEIGWVHCTKAGEQIALDAIDDMKPNGEVVTNDLHFSGSLHNLTGLQKAGRTVHIIRAEQWQVNTEKMLDAIGDKTALVCVSLISNVNGHLEAINALAEKAHKHGALVYADIIQAAGVVPMNMKNMGIDIAACSSYKWLYGMFGAGFVYVRHELQGTRMKDRLHPGRVAYQYQPWVDQAPKGAEPLGFKPNHNATRYQPGHVNYMGYCAAYEGLKFLQSVGVEKALAHSVSLNKRLLAKLDANRFVCISKHLDQSPIISFIPKKAEGLKKRLQEAKITITHIGNRIRISPALYNTPQDIDQLADVLNA